MGVVCVSALRAYYKLFSTRNFWRPERALFTPREVIRGHLEQVTDVTDLPVVV